jgi:O-acetyl-ADP-ribose deacetylase
MNLKSADPMEPIKIISGDITTLPVDAIVNAANATLMGGGGVDGAIHLVGGPSILKECKKIRETEYPDGLPTGEAVITEAGQLPATYVIHTVGPIYHKDPAPEIHLASCYRRCLQLASDKGLSSIAFPGISTGVYGYPKQAAASVAIATIHSFMADSPGSLQQVTLCAFSKNDRKILLAAKDAVR